MDRRSCEEELFREVNDMKDGIIGNIVTVTIDRPKGSHHPVYKDLCYPINYGYIDGVKGSHHPVYKDLCYPINYGYIDGVMAPDGEEQDAYIIGVDEPVKKFTGKVVAIIHRKDDIEDKWVACPENMTYTKSEICSMVYFQEQYFDYEVIVASEEANRVMEDYSIALGEIRSYASHRSHPVFTELQEAGRELRSGEEIDYHFKWNIVTVTIDRPKGSHHPVYKDLCYPINYGYIDGVIIWLFLPI